MKKIFFIFSIIVSFVLFSDTTSASAPAPSPKCYLEGTIQSVEFKDAYDNPCLTDKHGCPTDTELHYPARYFLKVKLNSASYVSGETDFTTCKKMLPLNTEKTIFINKNGVKAGDSFQPGQKIKGQVSSFWGISFDSYELGKPITDDQNKETSSNIIIYIIFTIAIIFILLFIMYLLKRSKNSADL